MRRRGRTNHSVSVLLALLGLLVVTTITPVESIDGRNCEYAQNAPENEEYTRLCVPEWGLNHTFSASTTAPIATELAKRPAATLALKKLISHMNNTAQRAIKLRDNPPKRFHIPSEVYCSRYARDGNDKSYASSVNVSTSQYGFGLVRENCETDITSERDEDLVDAMKIYVHEVDQIVSNAVGNAALNWPNATSYFKYNYNSKTDHCNIFHITAFRARGQWGINTGITNAGVLAHLAMWHRHYLVEVLRVDDNNNIVPIPMTLRKQLNPVWNDSKFTTPFITKFVPNSTTVMNTWGGIPATSLFRTDYVPADNPGFGAAIEVGAATLEQIQDALTPSGMSILIAPIALTLLPLALFAEVETAATLVYTIATDILTVFPLAIKGVELILYTNIRHDATRSRVYGGLTDDEPVAIETWYADCDANTHVIVMGWLFLSLAILFMLVGIILEIGAKYMLKGKTIFGRSIGMSKNRKQHQNHHAWQRAHAICSECEYSSSLPYYRMEAQQLSPNIHGHGPSIHQNTPVPAFDKDIV